MSKLFDEKLMTHDWPECGPGSVAVEDLYQAFRKRLLEELAREKKRLLVAEVIETKDCYIWRETAPATQAGYVELLYLVYAMLAALPPNKWAVRVPPEIVLVREWVGPNEKDERWLESWYECRVRLSSIASYTDWSKQNTSC